MKKWLIISLSLLSFILVERFCHRQTEGFQLVKIFSTVPFNPAWETPSLSPEMRAKLGQPFHFLSSGGQCFVFLSRDKELVLKVFKMHHMHPMPWLDKLKLPRVLDTLRQKIIVWRKELLERTFGSFLLCMQECKEETGILYLHLNTTSSLQSKLTLIDKLGIAHQIDLDKIPFALQERATLAYPHFDTLMRQGDLEMAKKCLTSLIRLLALRMEKGLSDRDPVIKRNFGFIGERAIEIDLGSFCKDPFKAKSYMIKRELFFQTRQLEEWLSQHHPILLSHFHEELHALLQSDPPL